MRPIEKIEVSVVADVQTEREGESEESEIAKQVEYDDEVYVYEENGL